MPQSLRVVCFALKFEAVGFCPPRGWEVWVLERAGAAAAKKFRARCVEKVPRICVLGGLAGGLRSDLGVGSIVVEPPAGRSCLALPVGRIATCDAPVASCAEKSRLHQETGADVCDMETAHLRCRAEERGVEFWSVRAVSDAAADDLPVPSRLLCSPRDGRPPLLALLGWLVIHPRRWAPFGRLVRQALQARSRLHLALVRLLEEWKG